MLTFYVDCYVNFCVEVHLNTLEPNSAEHNGQALLTYWDNMGQHPGHAGVNTALFKLKDIVQTPKSGSGRKRKPLDIANHSRFRLADVFRAPPAGEAPPEGNPNGAVSGSG